MIDRYAIAREELNYTLPGKDSANAAETELFVWFVKDKKVRKLVLIFIHFIMSDIRAPSGGVRHILLEAVLRRALLSAPSHRRLEARCILLAGQEEHRR